MLVAALDDEYDRVDHLQPSERALREAASARAIPGLVRAALTSEREQDAQLFQAGAARLRNSTAPRVARSSVKRGSPRARQGQSVSSG